MTVETPGEFSEQDFIGKLDWLSHNLGDISRNSMFDVAQYFPEQVLDTHRELGRYAGQVITGGSTYHEYYVADVPRAQTHRVGRLEYHRYSTNDFAGILLDMQDIHVTKQPIGDRTPEGRILCLKIAPIGDKPQARLSGFYEARRHQPFGVEQDTNTPIWVPIRPLKEGSVKFVDLDLEIV